ncbi:MAG: hypothetical protein ACK4KW_08205 [Gemmobacter sp.]
MPIPARTALLLVALSVSACAAVPELATVESAAARQAAYPRLAPIDALLARTEETRLTETEIGGVEARAAALRARAAGLRRIGG